MSWFSWGVTWIAFHHFGVLQDVCSILFFTEKQTRIRSNNLNVEKVVQVSKVSIGKLITELRDDLDKKICGGCIQNNVMSIE